MKKSELERRLENLFSDAPAVDVFVHPGDPATVSGNGQKPASAAPAEAVATPAPSRSDRLDFLKSILDHIPDPVFVKDRDHKWVAVNPAFCELTGQPADRLLSPAEPDVFDRSRADDSWALDEGVFETGQPVTRVQTIVCADGQIRTVRLECKPLSDTPDPIQYVIGIVHDITELKRAEEIQAKYRAEVERVQGEKRRVRKWSLLLAGLSIVIAVVSFAMAPLLTRSDRGSGMVYAAMPDPTLTATPVRAAAVSPTTTPTPILPATPVLSSTPTLSSTLIPSSTPTPLPPFATIAPTVDPQILLDASGTPIVPPTPAPLREFGPNVINIVLLGSDRRPGDTAWRTDVVILVSVDPDVPSITMLSFPRDLWVYIPGWRWQRINLADGRGQVSGFPGGGPALVKQTIQYNFGIPVQYYARVDFGGYKELIDSVGGVEVIADCSLYDVFPDVPDGQTDIITGVDLTTVPTGTIDIPIAGVYHLDGKHALWYARSRKTTSDFDRSRRQQRVLRGVWNAVREQGLIGQLPQLWDSVTQSVETDLTLNDVIYLANVGLRVDPAHIRSRFVDGSMLMWHVTETGASVLRYNYKTIAPYLDETFAPMPKNIASQAPAWVDVLNGTAHADWDRVAADRLGWDGFTVLSWGKADTLYDHTTLIDYTTTQKGSRLSALADLFGVAPDNVLKQPDRNSPVAYRVIVGADFEPCQRPSRGQWPTPVPSATPTTIP